MMKISTLFFAAGLLVFAGCGGPKDQVVPPREIWTAEQANDWYQQQGWLIGPNYSPASAINQLEMWQEDTFDPEMMDKELGWAAGLGMNTARVYLHDLLYEQDSTGFIKR